MVTDSAAVVARIVESSPVIVLLLLGAIAVLWRALQGQQRTMMAHHDQTTEAINRMTLAIGALTTAIQRDK